MGGKVNEGRESVPWCSDAFQSSTFPEQSRCLVSEKPQSCIPVRVVENVSFLSSSIPR